MRTITRRVHVLLLTLLGLLTLAGYPSAQALQEPVCQDIFTRSFGRVLKELNELEVAGHQGDVRPFDQFHILDLQFSIPSTIRAPRKITDPATWAKLRDDLTPLLAKHQTGVISVASPDEAVKLALFLRNEFDVDAFSLHSHQSKEVQRMVESQFSQRPAGFLVTTRQLGDDIELPDLSLYVDLSGRIGITHLVEGMIRFLKKSDGRNRVKISSLLVVDRSSAKEVTMFLQYLHDQALSGARSSVSNAEDGTASRQQIVEIIAQMKLYLKKRSDYLTFKEAKAWAREQKIVFPKDWKQRARTDKNWPPEIPKKPEDIYSGQGWNGWPDFLGTEFVTYEKARVWAQAKRIRTRDDWELLARSDPNWPLWIPMAPQVVYKDKGWNGWGEFLGTGPGIKEKAEQRASLAQAKAWANTLGIRTEQDWNALTDDSKTWPARIPKNPARAYQGKGWTDWATFLETPQLSYAEAKKWAFEQGIRTPTQWKIRAWSDANWPVDVPKQPHIAYKNSGWVDWASFLAF